MSDPSGGRDSLGPTQRALARLESLRAKGIPFDPLVEVASLRELIAENATERAALVAGDLERTCDRVETAWAELDLRRASVAYLTLTLRRRRGRSSPTLDAATEFLGGWGRPFADAPEVEARAQFARRLESLLLQQVAGVAGAAPAASAPPEGEPATSPPVPPGAPTVPPTGAAESGPGPEAEVPAVPPRRFTLPWFRSASGITFLVLAVFVLAGAFDRLHALGALSLWNDEAQSTLVSFSILQHGYPVITAQHVINDYEPLYPYLEAGSVAVLGHSNLAYRLPSAILGIGSIPLAYYVGSRLRDRYVGIAFAAMIAFSSEFIAWSRQARWYMLLVVLMTAAFLVATLWARTSNPARRRWLLIALVALGALAALASIGLFLLYIPAILVGAAVYAIAKRWPRILRFFGIPAEPGDPLPPARFLSYRERQWVAVGTPLILLAILAIAWSRIGGAATSLASRLLGFTPYSLVWSPNFGYYLEQYYLGVLVLAVLGAVFLLIRRDALELAFVGFCVTAFVSVSSLASLTNDISGGSASFERHILPLLAFLFLLAAVAIVELTRGLWRVLLQLPSGVPRLQVSRPVVFGVAVVMLLVLPGVVVPSGLTDHGHPYQYPTGQLVAWEPFSFDPAQPSALYQADQSDYQFAADYVLAHRNTTDVVAATNPGPPQVYLGQVQYWVRGDVLNTTTVQVNGQPTFFQTGSILIATTGQLEGVLYNTSGWLISDVPSGGGGAFPGGMDLVLADLMTKVSAGSGPSESLYHWNQTSPTGILLTLAGESAQLRKLAANQSALFDWAATNGTTTSGLRGLLLPMELFLVQHSSLSVRWLSVLFLVYNHRPDLQRQFPSVLVGGKKNNDTGLFAWAKAVVDGNITDPAEPALAPFKSYYDQNG